MMGCFGFLLSCLLVSLIFCAIDPHKPFDVDFRNDTTWSSTTSNGVVLNTFLIPTPFDYEPPPAWEYCTVYRKDPSMFTFEDGALRMWIRKNGNPKYKGTEFIGDGRVMSYGYYSFVMKMPSIETSGIWLEFGLSALFAFNAVVVGIVGKDPSNAYTSTTVRGLQVGKYHVEPGPGLSPDGSIDSRDGFHEYGLLYNPTQVIWYVDGIPIRSIKDDRSKIPSEITNMGFYIDLYPNCGGIYASAWLGHFDENVLPTYVEIQRLRYFPGVPNRIPLDADVNDPNLQFGSPGAPGFANWTAYDRAIATRDTVLWTLGAIGLVVVIAVVVGVSVFLCCRFCVCGCCIACKKRCCGCSWCPGWCFVIVDGKDENKGKKGHCDLEEVLISEEEGEGEERQRDNS